MLVLGVLAFVVVIGLFGVWQSHINADRENWSDEERRQSGVSPKGQRMLDFIANGPRRATGASATHYEVRPPSPRFQGPSRGVMLAMMIAAWVGLSWLMISAASPAPEIIYILIVPSMWPVAALTCWPFWAWMRRRARAAARL